MKHKIPRVNIIQSRIEDDKGKNKKFIHVE